MGDISTLTNVLKELDDRAFLGKDYAKLSDSVNKDFRNLFSKAIQIDKIEASPEVFVESIFRSSSFKGEYYDEEKKMYFVGGIHVTKDYKLGITLLNNVLDLSFNKKELQWPNHLLAIRGYDIFEQKLANAGYEVIRKDAYSGSNKNSELMPHIWDYTGSRTNNLFPHP